MNLCTGCKEDFTGVTNFEKHQTNYFEGDRMLVRCAPPASLGMTTNERGQWGYPGTLDPSVFDKDAVRPAPTPSTDKQRTCKLCGATFTRPDGRGRPPQKCPPCRGL